MRGTKVIEREDLLTQVCRAQTRNSTLASGELRAAAEQLVQICNGRVQRLMHADPTGERLIGAALSVSDELLTVDTSRRVDGKSVLLVTGNIAGGAGISLKAKTMRSLGASSVEAAVLGGWADEIEGCTNVWSIMPHVYAMRELQEMRQSPLRSATPFS